MAVWAIGDLHLSFGIAGKEMDIFGTHWEKHYEKIAVFWDEHVQKEDLVLIAGDISWAKHTEEVMPDLQWIADRPGTKLLIKGNHDYWWTSPSKVRKILPETVHILSQDVFLFDGIAVVGTRLWDTPEYTFTEEIDPPPIKELPAQSEEDTKVFEREILRLKRGLSLLPKESKIRIAMTHYPPIGPEMRDSTVSKLFDEANIDIAVFGHLHSLQKKTPLFGKKNTTTYFLVACDYTDFRLVRLV